MDKVNFFIVGAPKAGTTSMFDMLKLHPEIAVSKEKEPHYFCTDLHKESDKFHGKKRHYNIRTDETYHDLFKEYAGQKIIAEASTSYLYSKDAAKNIYAYNPDAKILIALREPVALMYSWFTYISSRSDENVSSFEEAYNLQDERSNFKAIPKSCITPTRLMYSRIVDFENQIEEYFRYFKRDRIKIVLFEDFIQSDNGMMHEICEFLDIEKISFQKLHSNSKRSVKHKAIKVFVDTHLTGLKYKLARTDNKLVKGLRSKYHDIMFQESTEQKPELFLDALKEIYKPKVASLERFLKMDLNKKWKYEV